MTEPYRLEMAGPGRNALSTAVMRDIIDQLDRAGGRPVLLTGAGPTFSAGLDLKEVASLDARGMERYLFLLDELIDAVFDYPGPTVACVNGHAIAGGCVLVLCCDLRVAVDDPAVRIGLNEVALGLEFPPKILRLAEHRLPRHMITRVLLEAGLHAPRTALALGLVDEVAAEAMSAATAALERLAAHPRAVYASTKATVRRGALALGAEAQRHLRETVVPAWCAPAVKERVAAALKPRR